MEDVLWGRPRRRKRKSTAAELANERRVLGELAELMEAGVLVDRSELVPPLADDDDEPGTSQPFEVQLELSFDGEEQLFCAGCLWHWHRSCEREGCWLSEFERTRK